MITEQELQAAIAECKGERNPNANTCIKLAAYYTILHTEYPREQSTYSYAQAPEDVVSINTSSAFAEAANGKPVASVWPLIDELVSSIQVLQPRLYGAFMRKLSEI